MVLTRTMRSFAAFVALALGLSPMMTSCSNKATEEQMKMVHQLDQQRDGLRMDLQRAQDNLRDAKGKLANADRDLADCQSDTKAATEALGRWPNVWPDADVWNPPPPPPPVVEPKKGKHGKASAKAATKAAADTPATAKPAAAKPATKPADNATKKN